MTGKGFELLVIYFLLSYAVYAFMRGSYIIYNCVCFIIAHMHIS